MDVARMMPPKEIKIKGLIGLNSTRTTQGNNKIPEV
jgi:hypothetical protein